MSARRPWKLARLLAALAVAAGALALSTPGGADTPTAVSTTAPPLAAIQAPADLPPHEGTRLQPALSQATTAAPSAAETAPQGAAPEPGALYLLALLVAGLLGGWRRASS